LLPFNVLQSMTETAMATPMNAPTIDMSFAHCWQASILAARPLILPPMHFVYPAQAEEAERGALEVLVRPEAAHWPMFLATCALGFRDAAVPTGIWSCPNPEELCAVAGGYAYVIDTTAPERFKMIACRPVMELRPVVNHRLILFVGHHRIVAWGAFGRAWETEKLTDEGVTITSIEGDVLHGTGWEMRKDRETGFTVDLKSGRRASSAV
jgi:hypothetical protein